MTEFKYMNVVDIAEKLSLFTDLWSPKIIGELNGQLVKVAKLKGEFIWHSHAEEDELFLVIKGSLTIKLKERDANLREGQFFIIPRGVEHLPVADEECHVLLFEPGSVLNTGDKVTDKTIATLERL